MVRFSLRQLGMAARPVTVHQDRPGNCRPIRSEMESNRALPARGADPICVQMPLIWAERKKGSKPQRTWQELCRVCIVYSVEDGRLKTVNRRWWLGDLWDRDRELHSGRKRGRNHAQNL